MEVSVNQNYISFKDFKSALLEASKIVTKAPNLDEYIACIQFIKTKLLPLALNMAEDRSI